MIDLGAQPIVIERPSSRNLDDPAERRGQD